LIPDPIKWMSCHPALPCPSHPSPFPGFSLDFSGSRSLIPEAFGTVCPDRVRPRSRGRLTSGENV
jgi:hypothetical protein